VGEAKEVERGSSRVRVACAFCPPWAEVDEACLVGMEHEPKPRQTLAQNRQDTFGVVKIVERHDRIISEPDKGAIPRKT